MKTRAAVAFEAKRPLAGYIGLQNHDPGDVVFFKEVSVRPLPGGK